MQYNKPYFSLVVMKPDIRELSDSGKPDSIHFIGTL